MADGRAYADLAAGTMQGNYGPDEKMITALGAYTPNVSWAADRLRQDRRHGRRRHLRGDTARLPPPPRSGSPSTGTPWSTYPEPWMRVEAVREALFSSATKWTPE